MSLSNLKEFGLREWNWKKLKTTLEYLTQTQVSQKEKKTDFQTMFRYILFIYLYL